jgi:diguanylate cyclase (GGDEF)-like protein
LDLKNTEVAEQLHDLQEINVSNLVFNINGKSMTEINRMINKMNEEIIRDSLTNTYNRRYMEERLLVDVFHAHNVGQPISVILSDIDLFKKVNDTYGHLAGDFVLKEFARIVMGNIRKNNDWVARYGGEEFLIVLLNADTNAAFRVAEKIRMAVENETIL